MRDRGTFQKISRKIIFLWLLVAAVLMQAGPVWAEEWAPDCPFMNYPPTEDENTIKQLDSAYLTMCQNFLMEPGFNSKCGNRCIDGCKRSLYTKDPAKYCGNCYLLTLASLAVKQGQSTKDLLYQESLPAQLDEVEQYCKGNVKGKADVEKTKQENCTTGPKHCCKTIVTKGDDANKGQIVKEQCPGEPPIYYGDCYCEKGGVTTPHGVKDYVGCEQECKNEGGKITNEGVGKFKNIYASAGLSQGQAQFINATCFTREECMSEEYGGSSDAIMESGECLGGKVKCRAPEPDLTLSSPILGVTTVKGLRQYLLLVFRFAMAIICITAAIAFIYGGFKYIVGSSVGSITSAKNTMVNSIVGLILGLSSVMILNTLNPAAIRLSRLDIFLVRRSLFSENQFCQDYKKAAGGKEPMFADPGDPVGEKPFDSLTDADFTLKVEDTKCGQEYYAPKDYEGKTCFGMACPKGQACLACKGNAGFKECEGSTRPFACIEAAFILNVNYSDGVEPLKAYLLGVCGHIQGEWEKWKFNSDVVKEQIPIAKEGTKVVSGNKVTFIWQKDTEFFQKFEDACQAIGTGNGIKGILLGIQYKDTNPQLIETLKAAKNSVDISKAVTQYTDGGLFPAPESIGIKAGAATVGAGEYIFSGSPADDVLVMKKADCTGGTKLFSGYANGSGMTRTGEIASQAVSVGSGLLGSYTGEITSKIFQAVTGSVEDDMKLAVYCGYRVFPGKKEVQKGRNEVFNGGYWESGEVERAFRGEDGISCGINLDKKNAPPNPGDLLMLGCTSGWCKTEDPHCSE